MYIVILIDGTEVYRTPWIDGHPTCDAEYYSGTPIPVESVIELQMWNSCDPSESDTLVNQWPIKSCDIDGKEKTYCGTQTQTDDGTVIANSITFIAEWFTPGKRFKINKNFIENFSYYLYYCKDFVFFLTLI